MEIKELKDRIIKNNIPKHLVFVNTCNTLAKEYLLALSRTLNKKIFHVYSEKEIRICLGKYDRDNLLLVAHDFENFDSWIPTIDLNIVIVLLEDAPTTLDKVIFPALNKEQCILYITDWLIKNDFYLEKKIDSNPVREKAVTLSRENQEKLIDYFENDLDLIMNELEKLKCLGVKSLDTPFNALFSCLPKKDKRLRSLPWYSGGAIDTATILYKTYCKKLKHSLELKVDNQKQKWYSQLIRAAVFVEVNTLAGTFGDYALEYFRLIERLAPDDFKVLWTPPVSKVDIDNNKEWLVK